MREPSRTFIISYFSEVTAEVTMVRSGGSRTGTIIANARHPSGTGMKNWYHFTDNDNVPSHLIGAEAVRASADIDKCGNEREAILQCLTNLADKLWQGLGWRAEALDNFDRSTFYKHMLQAFIVGKWQVKDYEVPDDVLPPKALSTRSHNN